MGCNHKVGKAISEEYSRAVDLSTNVFDVRRSLAHQPYPNVRSSGPPPTRPRVLLSHMAAVVPEYTRTRSGSTRMLSFATGDHENVAIGSGRFYLAKRAGEIGDQYSCSAQTLSKGVVWNSDKLPCRDRKLPGFDLPPLGVHKALASCSLRQPHFKIPQMDRLRAL